MGADRLVSGLQDRVFRAVHRSTLIYNTCWEDPRIDRQLLQLDADSRVVMLTSAGCNALDYLLDQPETIYAVDVNPRQNALLELKLALICRRPYGDLSAMFGLGAHSEHRMVYAALRPHLSLQSRRFWDDKISYFDPGDPRRTFYYHGGSGAVAWFFRQCIRHLKRQVRTEIFALLNATSLAEQRALYNLIEPALWDRFSCWVLTQPPVMAMLGVPRAQVDLAGQGDDNDLLSYIRARFRHVFTQVPIQDNYFWRVYLTGRYTPDCCPNYLRSEHQPTLQRLAPRIRRYTGTLSDFLHHYPGHYSHFVLLDHQDWLAGNTPAALAEEWRLILANSRPGAKILLRSAGMRLDFLPEFVHDAVQFFPERTEALHRHDRVGTYGSLHLAEVL